MSSLPSKALTEWKIRSPAHSVAAAPSTAALVVTDDKGRIPCLDGLRGLASAVIVLYHFGPHIVRAGGPFQFLHQIPPLFFAGVDLFFVLSGFLIGGILLDARASTNYYRTFYIRRALRLLPLYYLILGAYLLCGPLFAGTSFTSGALFQDPVPTWPYWFHLQNFTMTVFNTFGPLWLAGSWSLAIEEQFYLLLPLVVRTLSPRTLWRSCWIAWVISLLFRAANAKFRLVPGMGSYVLLPARMDGLAMGVIVAYAIRYQSDFVLRWRSLWPKLAAVATVTWAIYPYLPNPQSIRLAFIDHTVNSVVFGLILLSAILFPRGKLSGFLSLRGMRELGNLSYATYLLHPILLGVVFHLYSGTAPRLDKMSDLLPVGIALTAVFTLAKLSSVFLEGPILRLGRRFQY